MDQAVNLMFKAIVKFPKPMRKFVKQTFSSLGLELQLKNPAKLIEPWNSDESFIKVFELAEERTVVDKIRCYIIYQFLRQTANLKGDIAEIGVYKGGTARLISTVTAGTEKHIHLFDTFSGMPPTNAAKDNFYEQGSFKDTSLQRVKSFLKDCTNITIYPGIFPGTAEPILNKQFSFVHVDVDIYQSTLDACSFFYPRLAKGGILLFDDYGFLDCAGEKLAVDEFFRNHGEFPCYLPTGQCFVAKL
jgi:O-methyltransferase